MSGLFGMFGVFVIVLVVAILAIVGMYNSLIGLKNQVENVYATVDTLLKKRYDLIPNLVASVQQYMTHERETLTNITEMRAKATSGNLSTDQQVQLDNQITKAMGGIMVAVENYPDLKANQNFLQLQASLNEVEEQISAGRRAYNASVTSLNNAIEMFPTSIIASMMSLEKREWFEIPEAQRENVDVKAMFAS